jgi:xanthine dehydrogenase accessory factor
MTKQIQTWKLIKNNLQENIPVMLLYVLESSGSSPGRQGFFMAVNIKGDMEGSIGGGIMEHKFVEMAKDKLHEEEKEISIRKQFHDKTAAKNQSGMICSGEQTILLYTVQQDDKNHIQNIIKCLEENKNGTLEFTSSGIEFSESIPELDFHFEMKSENDWDYKEKIGYKNYLFVVGGGHCALAFSKIMCMMDFYIKVYDERKGLNTMQQNVHAHELIKIDDYSFLEQAIPSGESNYVVIMTFGYRTDVIALRALMNKKFKYFGLLGSQKKIEKMFTDLRAEGIPEKTLDNIHSPIGIQIKSQTPEEIATSIAAEIISVKNSRY